jgi:hypothetical protein
VIGKEKNRSMGKKGANWAFMKLNEVYSKRFNSLIKTKEYSPIIFREDMTPSI